MAIKKVENKYILHCDYCNRDIKEFNEYIEAIIDKKENEWKTIIRKNGWFDKCPECARR